MKRWIFFILLNAGLGLSAVFAQCPMCKTALTSSRDRKESSEPVVGNGINSGILFLLATPYVLVGTAGFFYYQNFKKNKAKGV
ncbi:MAG: hypothetical protein ACO3GK_08005 [Bacteroidia bacterium]